MDIADRVRHILSIKRLSLYRVSKHSAEIFGRTSPYYIPHNLYSDLHIRATYPNLHQLASFSRISNYRLVDWLGVFGFHLDDIPRLQVLLSSERTRLLDSSIYDQNAWFPWFGEDRVGGSIPPIAPLSQIMRSGSFMRAGELLKMNRSRFTYAKLGRRDLLSFPELLPGSIVRIDPRRAAEVSRENSAVASKQIFLVENNSELNCCRVRRISKDRILLCSSQFPLSQFEGISEREVRIHGVVDAEILRFVGQFPSLAALRGARLRKGQALKISASAVTLNELIRSSRIRAGLSFREASRTYFAAMGTLSDYEATSGVPRHVQKIISLCILYSIGFWDFLRLAGIPAEWLGVEPMPDEFVPRPTPHLSLRRFEAAGPESLGRGQGNLLQSLVEGWNEIPLFLANSLGGMLGSTSLSLSDVFWVGGDHNLLEPALLNAIFVIVNRRIKRPEVTDRRSWEPPLYVVFRRDGRYFCGACTIERGSLVIHSSLEETSESRELGTAVDAEVIGKVTAIVRRIV
jgi:hypothetical protein